MASQSKRPRQSAGDISSSSSVDSPTRTARRTEGRGGGGGQSHGFVCTLPPTCNHRSTPLQTSKDMESHYAKFHAHVCASSGCASVFPDEHLLTLHQTECHDPLAALRKDRGERIFGCFVQTCMKSFGSPKNRRLHLIEVHKYPKEYFFAVTNKGIGGLLHKWGEGASMIRGTWKAKDIENDEDESDDVQQRLMVEEDDDSDEPEAEPTPKPPPEPLKSIDDLADSMTSLSLVPSSVRFGRGRGGGLADKRGRGRGGSVPTAAAPITPRAEADMDVDVIPINAPPRGRGGAHRGPTRGAPPRGGRGQGRGRGIRGGRGRILPFSA